MCYIAYTSIQLTVIFFLFRLYICIASLHPKLEKFGNDRLKFKPICTGSYMHVCVHASRAFDYFQWGRSLYSIPACNEASHKIQVLPVALERVILAADAPGDKAHCAEVICNLEEISDQK
jgi:hypothetical protein